MVNRKVIRFRIKPYVLEATSQAVIDIIVMGVLGTVLMIVKFPPILSASAVIGYFIIALILHYRVLIQALADKCKGDFITETVSVGQFTSEYSFAGNRLGHSHVHKLYPKEQHVDRYSIKVVNKHGEKKKIRGIMSLRKTLQFLILHELQINYLQITYMKRSKILLQVKLTEELDKKTKRTKRDSIQKALHFINSMSI